MSKTKSPNGTFEIVELQHDDDSYMYSNTRHDWRVVSVVTGDQFAQFSGSSEANASGSSESGTVSVSFSDSGDAVIATDADGTTERVLLPASVRTVEGGKQIETVGHDGTIVREKRRPAIMWTKYGQVICHPLVDDPGK